MLRKICSIASTALIVLLLALVALFVVPKFIGYTPNAVLSGSMEPNYPVGSIVFIRHMVPAEVKVNDVIMFTLNDGIPVTHRVIDILPQEQAFITKGDANEAADFSPVPFNRMVGVVKFSIPVLGFVAVFLKTGIGIFALCTILVALVLLEFLPQFIKRLRKTTQAPQ